jgi:SulP family sulfate permease
MNDAQQPSKLPEATHRTFRISLLQGYQRQWLMADILAGLSVCIVMIPSVIAYAELMGIPPQHGLYAALVPLIIYPFFGSSRHMIVGPDIAISLLMASAIAPLAGGDSGKAAALSATIALICGLLLIVGARVKLGAVADFLSKPVLVGYMTGAALILMASQFDKLFGIHLDHGDFFPRLVELAGKIQLTHLRTLLLGLGLLALGVALRKLAPKVPAALVVVVTAIVVSQVFNLENYGVAVIGKFPHALPAFAIPHVAWRDVHTLLPAAVAIALLTYTEGILLARAFAAKHSYEVNANQELTALGLADLATGLFQGFAITASQSRTTINDSAGGKSQVVSLVAAGALALFIAFLTPVLAHLPSVALAALLIYGGFTLVEFDVMKRIYRFYPSSGIVAAITTLGVLAAGVVIGILIGVALSLLGLIRRLSHPPDAVLSEVPGDGFHDLGKMEVQTLPGLIAYRFYAPLLFSNVGHFVQRVREVVAAAPTPLRWFLLDAQAITDVDVTASEALHSLHEELRQKGIALKIAHANLPLRSILERTGLAQEIGADGFFPSVHECVGVFRKGTSTQDRK